jgi:3-deoxy-7-phosphoheptulonate synthase
MRYYSNWSSQYANFELLKKVGFEKARSPQERFIFYYRGLATAAEYILSWGNFQVILCERGIRTIEKFTRNTLDLTAIPVVKDLFSLT